MKDQRILHVIQELERIRSRRMMFMGSNSASAASTFLLGFQSACFVFGLTLSYKHRQLATEERGWSPSAEAWSLPEMRERGLTDEAIADEMLAIDIAAWRRMAEASAA